MTRIWTPEELARFEAKIAAARAGDVGSGAGLLRWITACLERGWPLPEPLRQYLVDALREITRNSPADIADDPLPHVVPKSFLDLREFFRAHESTRDANVALNLKRPRGNNRTVARTLMEQGMFTMAVHHEVNKGSSSVEDAVETVADQMGVSEQTVWRAWRNMKGPLYGL